MYEYDKLEISYSQGPNGATAMPFPPLTITQNLTCTASKIKLSDELVHPKSNLHYPIGLRCF